MRPDATKFPCSIPAISNAQILAIFSTFSTFSTFRPWTFFFHLLLIQILIGHPSSLALPHPIHRSHYSRVFYVVAVAYIAVADSQLLEKKAWHPGTPHLEIPCYSNHQPPLPWQARAMQLSIGRWYADVGMGNAMEQRIGNEGIAFLRVLWALVIASLQCSNILVTYIKLHNRNINIPIELQHYHLS